MRKQNAILTKNHVEHVREFQYHDLDDPDETVKSRLGTAKCCHQFIQRRRAFYTLLLPCLKYYYAERL